jgi:hypothetical protein
MNPRALPFLLFWAALFAAFNVFADVQSSLQVSPSSVTVNVGDSTTLSVSHASGTVSASSSDSAVVSASYSNGNVTLRGIKAGSATVTVKDRKTSVAVSVTVQTMQVSPSAATLSVGDSATLAVSSASGSVSVSSGNTSVVTASYSNGNVTLKGIKAGSTTVTVKDSKTSVVVSVTVQTMQVSPSTATLSVGGSATLAVSSASGSVSVSSGNTSVVTASYSNGNVTLKGVKAGSTTVTVKDSKTSVAVSVTVGSAQVMQVSPTTVALSAGGTASLAVTNASGTVSVSSGNTGVVTASYANNSVALKAIANGSATVTVKDSKTSVAVSVVVTSGGVVTQTGYTLLAWNDLGMHCVDGKDYSVFSILPPYNNLHAHLVSKATGQMVASNVNLTYEAVADSTGSINTISSTKTNFWSYALSLFGANPAKDVGLNLSGDPGNRTPSLTPVLMKYNATQGWFEAEGIPITPYDDKGAKNFYPMVKVVAKDLSGNVLATTQTVLPVSDEMTCKACHSSTTLTSNAALIAAKPTAGWVFDADAEKDWKKNILRLHDEKKLTNALYKQGIATNGYNAAGLLATANAGRPILCASCHGTNALGAAGITGISKLTQALHTKHSKVKDPATQLALDSITNRTSCYMCHPGSVTQCLRGAMGVPKDASGNMLMGCQSCHGSMTQVGSTARQGWFNEPTCQGCHHDGKRETVGVDANGVAKVWTDQTFASNANTPAAGLNLFRFSKGHGNLQCEACHGPTHAEYPTDHTNDNVQSLAIQGHTGTINECASCHSTVPTTVNGGPHGMHTTGDAWVSAHKKASKTNCAYCHGTTSAGTPLSAIKVAKTINKKNFAAGTQISCYSCHNGPNP